MVKLLRKLGADMNAASSTGTTAVNFACFQGRKNIVKYLVQQGADIHRPRRERRNLSNEVRSQLEALSASD